MSKKESKQLIFHLSNKEATRKNILRKLTDLKKKVTSNDNLIIYFSGHGETEDNTGFWIPVEAHPEEEDEFISTNEIKRKLNVINSFHTFLLVDACFSGSLFQYPRNIRAGVESKPSRWGLAASHSREVALDGTPGENSPFSKGLLKILKNSTEDLSIFDLSNEIIKEVARSTRNKQTPVFQPLDLKGHELGQYVFHLKEDKEAQLIAEFEIELKEGIALIETGQIRKAKRYLNGLLKDVKEEIRQVQQQERLSQLILEQLEICKDIPKYKPIFEKILGKVNTHKLVLTEKEALIEKLQTELNQVTKEFLIYKKKENQFNIKLIEKEEIISDLKSKIRQKNERITELEKAILEQKTRIEKSQTKSRSIDTPIVKKKEMISLEDLMGTELLKTTFDSSDNIPIEMIPVKGGTFKLSSEVTLDDYHISKYPVTQELWETVMGNNPAHFKGNPKYPIEKISWEDTQEFIKKLNQKTGKSYRLPTEAEWEFAARGGIQSKGFEYAGSNNLEEVGWYKDNADGKTHPVGAKTPNELDIHDMSGNVWEWCQDWYVDYPSSPQKNPQGAKSDSDRVLRGGSWCSLVEYCRVSLRLHNSPVSRCNDYGFRIAHSSADIQS